LIDWASFTLPFEARQAFIEAQGLETTPIERAYYGYSQGAVTLDGALIMWNPERPEMGCHFSINGASLPMIGDLRAFLQAAIDAGGHFTRLDVALDDRAGLLDWQTIERAVRACELTSRWKSAKVADDVDFSSGAVSGRIIRFGQRASRASARLYDKQMERIAKGEPDPGHWLRYEVEFHAEDADTIARLALADEWARVLGVIRGYLDFRTPNGDSNKSRWPVADWWARFMGFVSKVKGLFSGERQRTIEDVRRWVARQVSPSLALLLSAGGGDFGAILKMADAGRASWKAKHRAILQQALLSAPIGA
jgi:phage replication initiation protein